MRGDFGFRVEPANQIGAPMQQADGIIPPECQPVERIGIATSAVRRMHRGPVTETIAMPGATQGLDGSVFGFQPLAELGLGSGTIAFLHPALVPHVITEYGRISAITLHHRSEEFFRVAADFFIVETHGRAAGRAAAADGGKVLAPLDVDAAALGIFVPHPLRRPISDFGDHHLDMVLAFQFHHAVIVAPVIFTWRIFDRRPHEPVAEDVHSHLRRSLMVAFPILFGRVRFAEIDRAERKHGIRELLLRLETK